MVCAFVLIRVAFVAALLSAIHAANCSDAKTSATCQMISGCLPCSFEDRDGQTVVACIHNATEVCCNDNFEGYVGAVCPRGHACAYTEDAVGCCPIGQAACPTYFGSPLCFDPKNQSCCPGPFIGPSFSSVCSQKEICCMCPQGGADPYSYCCPSNATCSSDCTCS
jgi:hypothetical protein